MVDIDHVAITALAAGDGYFAAGRDRHGRAVRRINVLTLMIFVSATAERIPAAADAAFKLADDRPN